MPYRVKPLEVQVVMYDGDNFDEIIGLLGDDINRVAINRAKKFVYVRTHSSGDHIVRVGEYIVVDGCDRVFVYNPIKFFEIYEFYSN